MRPSDYCKHCDLSVTSDHWYWQRSSRCAAGGYWRCKKENRDNAKRWRKDSFIQCRLTEYRAMDKRRGFECTLTIEEMNVFLNKPCYYCDTSPAKGLDRIINDRGHACGNVVPCCEKCNYILSDLPFEAKEKLKSGLYVMRQEGLLKHWTIPTKRRFQCN